jgi:amino acid adenylation domain-containing protein/thioester reductase-like protein
MYKIKLSPYHKIFYNEWKINPSSSKYNILFDQTLSKNLDISRLQSALFRLINNHLILNCHVKEEEDKLYWVKNKKILSLECINATNLQDIERYVVRTFKLNSEPLYRFAVFSQENGFRLIMVMHHIIIDGNSFVELLTELSKYYNDFTYTGNVNILDQKTLIISTTKQIYKQLGATFKENKQFWSKFLQDTESIDLRFIKTFNSKQIQNLNPVKNVCFNFDKEIIKKLDKVKDKFKLSFYNYGQIIFAILLHKYSYQEKFGISYTIAIKQQLGLIYGAGINTNIIPYAINEYTSLFDLINYSIQFVQMVKSKEFNHRNLPINDILNGKDKNLPDVYFGQVELMDFPLNFDDVTVLSINDEYNTYLGGKLAFEQEFKNQILNYRVRYDATKIDTFILDQFIKHYKKLFVDVLSDLEQELYNKTIYAYSLLDNQEFKHIFYDFCQPKCLYPSNKSIHQLFEEQAAKNPNNIAIIYENTKLTYQELNHKANRLSHYLIKSHQTKPDDLIALYLDRSELTIIAILAVLKSGCAYVPIDPNYPIDRASYILSDSKAKVMLANQIYQNILAKFIVNVDTQSNFFNQSHPSQNFITKANKNFSLLLIDSKEFNLQLTKEADSNPNLKIKNENLAYVIYTSGTTGKPKGVLQQHNNVVRLFLATDSQFKFNKSDTWVLFHSYVFDFTIWEMWGALFYGGKLVIPTQDQTKDLELFYLLCKNNNVTILNQTPSVFYQFSEIVIKKSPIENLTNLRSVIFGGEALNLIQLKSWIKHYGDKIKLINMYGITETTVHVTYKLISAGELDNGSLIGSPLSDQFIYLLDRSLNFVPIGAIGELYIGGGGLARAYLNQPELTKQKFIENPFLDKIDQLYNNASKLYKTGDLARGLRDGELEYIGRNDSQVKIRGYRIELQEIENVLRNYPGIEQAIVIVKEHKDNRLRSISKYLVGYYVADNKIDSQEIIAYLAERIPEYMVPNIFVYLKNLPLTINGKLDQNALPKPNFGNDHYIMPCNEKEQIVCDAFASILGLEKVGATDDFFMFGGNSILTISLVSKLHINFKISVNDIFKLRTPKRIAESVSFSKDNLKHKLKQIKLVYLKHNDYCKNDEIIANNKKHAYFSQVKSIKFKQALKPINNVLLSGATGYLGCNLLHQFLTTTQYRIYLLIRAPSIKEAFIRVNNKFKFYFDKDLSDFENRVIIYVSDIEKQKLNLSDRQYSQLKTSIDSIIHTAALVKHYGHYDDFYQANVQATINLLELARFTKNKDFHYISTKGVFMDGYIPNSSYYVFTENDSNEILQNQSNLYVKTKHEGESEVIKYRKYGVNSNIYRVGNLLINSKNYRTQENIEENASFVCIETMLNYGMVPQELSEVEISPVDFTASAIIRLFNQIDLSNQTYHVFNPYRTDIFELFSEYKDLRIVSTKLDTFIDVILEDLKDNNNSKQIELFMLHQLWLQDIDLEKQTKIDILLDKTNYILSKLGFSWKKITSNMMYNVTRSVLEKGKHNVSTRTNF